MRPPPGPGNAVPAEHILGFPVTTLPLGDCLGRMKGWIDGDARGRYFACANPHSLEVALEDGIFRTALLEADLLVPDGTGIVLASRILGGTIRARITGSDVFEGLCAVLDEAGGYRVGFLGSSEATLGKIRAEMGRRYPSVRVDLLLSPPFRQEFDEEEDRRMVEAVNRARPHVLWVGMTAPKQEKWIHRNRHRLNVPFLGAIGAVFDFFAGTVKRSPEWAQRAGMEWLPRLAREPRRLWRRNIVSSPRFLYHVLRQRMGKSGQHR